MSLSDLLRRNMVLDSCGEKIETKKSVTLDAISENAEKYAMHDMKIKAVNAITSWLATDDLDDEEGSADRLMALFVGIVDANKDGEIDEDEAVYLEALLNYAWDYFETRGISDDDVDLLLNDWDADAANRIMELLNGDESSDDDLDSFAFGDDENEAVFDAVYKNVAAVRGGKKVRIRKKISGTVRLTAKQKIGIRKMLKKSHSASAQMKRMKSMKIRKQGGL